MPIARMRRVSSGSMTPSSHSRAVAKYGRALALVGLEDRRLEGVALGVVGEAAADRREDPGRLRAAHHARSGVRPRPQEPRLVGATGHRVVAGAEAAADEHRELGHLGRGDRGHELRAVLGDAGLLVLAADHEPGDVLEEDERDPALAGELDEVGALERRLAEQDPVVGEDRDRVALDVGEAGDQRLAVERLELVEPRAVDEPGDDLADRDRPARIERDRAVEARPGRPPGASASRRSHGGVGGRRLRFATIDRPSASACSSSSASWSATPERRVWTSEPPSSSGVTSSPVAAFTSGGPPRKIVPGALDDDGLVAHRRDVRAAGRAASP